jgi:arylformamidase
MLIQISYPLSLKMPLYPNTPALHIAYHKSINQRDNSNSSLVTLSNHSGTHIDLPLHFCKNGKSVMDLLTEENFFSPVYCLDIPKNNKEPVQPDDFQIFLPEIQHAEAILVRTGMYRIRGKPEYISDYPHVDPEVPRYLRTRLPNLKLFGIDTLSVANPSHKEAGRECHRNFLCNQPNIMILEDVNLANARLTEGPGILRLYPWILENLDAVPVIAMVEAPNFKNSEEASRKSMY